MRCGRSSSPWMIARPESCMVSSSAEKSWLGEVAVDCGVEDASPHPHTVTCTGSRTPCALGAMQRTASSEIQRVAWHGTPPTVATGKLSLAPNPVPRMMSTVPPARGAWLGSTLRIRGGSYFHIASGALETPLFPSTATVMGRWLPVPWGALQRMSVGRTHVNDTQLTMPTLTSFRCDAVMPKLLPVIVMMSPPRVRPCEGSIESTSGQRPPAHSDAPNTPSRLAGSLCLAEFFCWETCSFPLCLWSGADALCLSASSAIFSTTLSLRCVWESGSLLFCIISRRKTNGRRNETTMHPVVDR
mmetsp:Transcript_49732/g.158827  ORF Transcript_49732/g.158827 Transcript_49732/m.158827 type:complete len:301 (+) Transcript_49732:473-1375(+)